MSRYLTRILQRSLHAIEPDIRPHIASRYEKWQPPEPVDETGESAPFVSQTVPIDKDAAAVNEIPASPGTEEVRAPESTGAAGTPLDLQPVATSTAIPVESQTRTITAVDSGEHIVGTDSGVKQSAAGPDPSEMESSGDMVGEPQPRTDQVVHAKSSRIVLPAARNVGNANRTDPLTKNFSTDGNVAPRSVRAVPSTIRPSTVTPVFRPDQHEMDGTTEEAEPAVTVRIGRIEVRAVPPVRDPAPTPIARPRQPALSLGDYLNRRNEDRH